MAVRLNSNNSSLIQGLALLSLLLPTIVNAEDCLPEPDQVSEHCWTWVGPYGPPTKKNRGSACLWGASSATTASP
jgi:hypothetical protein